MKFFQQSSSLCSPIAAIVFLSLTSLVSAQIEWDGYPTAKSSLGDGEAVLSPSNAGAQFMYTKTASSGPLVTVKIQNGETGFSADLQTDFDMIAQKCSCYYIDMKDLVGSYGDGIKSSRSYRLTFAAADYSASSGYFTIITSNDVNVNDLPAPSGGDGNSNENTPTNNGGMVETEPGSEYAAQDDGKKPSQNSKNAANSIENNFLITMLGASVVGSLIFYAF